eukprot:TRINITY_DN56057_c0_g1_i1.p1 TRINITY_DN56057_c0_g1~~TRINITY_DN56057_c0_g1_i1.p1  ORF type:complete len:255 (+),score=49.91 TRINITY_DN56057_c0_g1_i1:64-828(+)
MQLAQVSLDVLPGSMTLKATVVGSPEGVSLALQVPMGHYFGARHRFGDDKVVSDDLVELKRRFVQWTSEARNIIMQELLSRVNAALSVEHPVNTEGPDMSAGGERFDPPQFLLDFIKGPLAKKATNDAMQRTQANLQQAFASFQPNVSLPQLFSPSPHPAVTLKKWPGYILSKAHAWECVMSEASQHFSSVHVHVEGSADQSFPMATVKIGNPPTHAVPVFCRDNDGIREVWAMCWKDGVTSFDLLDNFHFSQA